MIPFKEYARYYDLLYKDKDYAAEAKFVEHLIHTYAPAARSILDLGCGTGQHAALLAGHGFQVQGIDRSEGMLLSAEKRRSALSGRRRRHLKFSKGDIRTVRLGTRFDVVISLFHVMSYQTGNDDLNDAFATAREHLVPGGTFIFDCWYGPAVLTQRPSVRIKRLCDKEIEVIRTAEPELLINENCVKVNYEIDILCRADGKLSRFSESHHMRYLFLPEIQELFHRHAMSLIFACGWMSCNEPGADTWSLCVGGKVTG